MSYKTLLRGSACAVVLAVGLLAGGAQANEGLLQYPNGVEGFAGAALPPPGTYFLNYTYFYSADQLNGNNGNPVPGVKVNATAYVDALRALYVSPYQILGGNWSMHAIVPFGALNAQVQAGASPVLQHGTQTGLMDIDLDPVVLSFHWTKNWHGITGVDVYAPTGAYKASNVLNLGHNHWGVEPLFGVSYLADTGWDANVVFRYEVQFANSSPSLLNQGRGITSYTSGDVFHFDYDIGNKVGNFHYGLAGYYAQQVSNDKNNLGTLAGTELMTWSAGPALQYDYNGMMFSAKWMHEIAAKNTAQGDVFETRFVMAF